LHILLPEKPHHRSSVAFFFYPVLEASHRKAVRLIIVVAVDRGVAGIQVAIPRVRSIVGRRRPKVRVRRPIVEAAVRIAVAG